MTVGCPSGCPAHPVGTASGARSVLAAAAAAVAAAAVAAAPAGSVPPAAGATLRGIYPTGFGHCSTGGELLPALQHNIHKLLVNTPPEKHGNTLRPNSGVEIHCSTGKYQWKVWCIRSGNNI